MLTFIKSTHSLIWLFFNTVIIIMYYEVITNHITNLFWIGHALIAVEFFVLLIYKWQCPLTIVARNYSDSEKENFDIYLPIWLAKHNKTIYTILYVLIWCIYLYQRIGV